MGREVRTKSRVEGMSGTGNEAKKAKRSGCLVQICEISVLVSRVMRAASVWSKCFKCVPGDVMLRIDLLTRMRSIRAICISGVQAFGSRKKVLSLAGVSCFCFLFHLCEYLPHVIEMVIKGKRKVVATNWDFRLPIWFVETQLHTPFPPSFRNHMAMHVDPVHCLLVNGSGRRRNRNTKDVMELTTGQEAKGLKGAVLTTSLVQDRERIHVNY